MKFAIIGKGFIYPRHIQAIKHIGGEIVDQISLKDGENAWKDMIKKTEADCVVVLTPNDLHYPMCKLALDSGKIVLCEKPITINAKANNVLSFIIKRKYFEERKRSMEIAII